MKQKNHKLDIYVIDHLKDYIKYHLERGYSQKAVKEALLKFGYTSRMLDNIIKDTKIIHKNLEKPYSEKDLEGETYYYLRSMICDYISKQLKHGFNLNEIKKALINYGHHKDIVEDAIEIIKGKGKIKINRNIVFWISIFLILLFITFMSLILDSNFIFTLIIFSPGLISLILSRFILNLFKKSKKYLHLISVVLSIILFFSIFSILNQTDADTEVILALNAAIAFITTYFYSVAEEGREKKRNGDKS